MLRTRILFGLAALFPVAAAQASLSASPLWVDFSNVPIGSQRTQYVYVTNYGPEVARSPFVSSDCYTEFDMMTDCRFDLRPYDRCQVMVTYRPRTTGPNNCSIYVSALGTAREWIRVSGRAIPPRLQNEDATEPEM